MPSWRWQGNFHFIRSVVLELSHADRHNESTDWCQRTKKNLLMKYTTECSIHCSLLQNFLSLSVIQSVPYHLQFNLCSSLSHQNTVFLQSPFITVRSVDVLPHTKQTVLPTELSMRNISFRCLYGTTVPQDWNSDAFLITELQQLTVSLFPGWPLLLAEIRVFCRLLPVTTRLWGQF